ncbi:hypothetical protein ACQY0O_001824 [Thecaphora frezii]
MAAASSLTLDTGSERKEERAPGVSRAWSNSHSLTNCQTLPATSMVRSPVRCSNGSWFRSKQKQPKRKGKKRCILSLSLSLSLSPSPPHLLLASHVAGSPPLCMFTPMVTQTHDCDGCTLY